MDAGDASSWLQVAAWSHVYGERKLHPEGHVAHPAGSDQDAPRFGTGATVTIPTWRLDHVHFDQSFFKTIMKAPLSSRCQFQLELKEWE